MARKRRAKRNNFRNFSEEDFYYNILTQVSKDIDETILEWKSCGKRFDLLNVIKMVASKAAIDAYGESLSDLFSVGFNSSNATMILGEAVSKSNEISLAIRGEKALSNKKHV